MGSASFEVRHAEKLGTVRNAGRFSSASILMTNLFVPFAAGEMIMAKPHKQWSGTGWHLYEERQAGLSCAMDCEGCAAKTGAKAHPALPFEDPIDEKRKPDVRERKKQLKRRKHLG